MDSCIRAYWTHVQLVLKRHRYGRHCGIPSEAFRAMELFGTDLCKGTTQSLDMDAKIHRTR